MISGKLCLWLNHDYRDFCCLKRQLVLLTSAGSAETEMDLEIQRNKERIRNLKQEIEHETNRLIRLAVSVTAELIEKIWLGFAIRQRLQASSTISRVEVMGGT
jgi:hypothetical protein